MCQHSTFLCKAKADHRATAMCALGDHAVTVQASPRQRHARVATIYTCAHATRANEPEPQSKIKPLYVGETRQCSGMLPSELTRAYRPPNCFFCDSNSSTYRFMASSAAIPFTEFHASHFARASNCVAHGCVPLTFPSVACL